MKLSLFYKYVANFNFIWQFYDKCELLNFQSSAATYLGVVGNNTSIYCKFPTLSSGEKILKIG